jgi:hypothetical protein
LKSLENSYTCAGTDRQIVADVSSADERIAIHIELESCGFDCEVRLEALIEECMS